MSSVFESDENGAPSFLTQTNALLRKNLVFQKRTRKTTIRLIILPIYLCVLLAVLQFGINKLLSKYKCGCHCVPKGDGSCENVCGVQYSNSDQADFCAISSPQEWPALLQVPRPESRAARDDTSTYADLPDGTCREKDSCSATVLFTGSNQSIVNSLASNLFPSYSSPNFSDYLTAFSELAAGTDTPTDLVTYREPAFRSGRPIYILQSQCGLNTTFEIPIGTANATIQQEIKCVQGLPLWRDNYWQINGELFNGYRQANTERMVNEYMAAYDASNTDEKKFNMIIWYNSTYNNATILGPPRALLRVIRSVNLISNAYLQLLLGSGVRTYLEFVKEMPKSSTKLSLDFSSILSPLFFVWVIGLLFPVMLTILVYEKQHKLRMMMRMHGLRDGPYWMISYVYFLLLSLIYVLFFVIFGSVIGLKFFRLNDYSIQFVFYFIYINLQIVLALLSSTFFSNVKTAQGFAYLYIFATGLMAANILQPFIQDNTFPRRGILAIEIVPAFALYRGLYEFSQYSFTGDYMATSGMVWKDLNDNLNGMKEVLIIISIEWLVLLPLAYYLDQVGQVGNKIRRNPLCFWGYSMRKTSPSQRLKYQGHNSVEVSVQMEKPDIIKEVEMVERLVTEPNARFSIICDQIKKIYHGKDGNQDKVAVRGVSLALQSGECFGILGPNGAGKTTLINMLTGLIEPTSGNALVQGFNILADMNKIYNNMGVCPQKDMLWEMLTGREHLFFYGRLKNRKGSSLLQAVDESLRRVNLFYGGVADKQVRKYSGGMKRRLSVAISLIGDPKVVYMDEPSTGLDPASRKKLWDVLTQAKQNKTIILTTHSMEEAEVLCDRLAIMADGSIQCLGTSRELKARYGGSYIFTVTTSTDFDEDVGSLASSLSPNARKIYDISGTQKFLLPKQEVKISNVFSAVESFKRQINVQAWGLADETLEDVFIKVAKGTESSDYM